MSNDTPEPLSPRFTLFASEEASAHNQAAPKYTSIASLPVKLRRTVTNLCLDTLHRIQDTTQENAETISIPIHKGGSHAILRQAALKLINHACETKLLDSKFATVVEKDLERTLISDAYFSDLQAGGMAKIFVASMQNILEPQEKNASRWHPPSRY